MKAAERSQKRAYARTTKGHVIVAEYSDGSSKVVDQRALVEPVEPQEDEASHVGLADAWRFLSKRR
jgi:hypothetical protein